MLSSWAATAVDPLTTADPRVLGTVGAFVFVIFVMEIVVSGKAYKREVEENARLREMFTQFIPVAEEMIAVSKQMVVVTQSTGRALEDFVDFMADEGVRRRR